MPNKAKENSMTGSVTRKAKTATTKPQVEIENSPYWLNFDTPFGFQGLRLAYGIKQHTTMLELIGKHGVEKFNKVLEKQGFNGYIVDENNKSTDKYDAMFDDIE